jgi:hypothetical protein
MERNNLIKTIIRSIYGKIVQSRTFYNEADVLRQLRYMITPPQEIGQ